MSKIYKTARGKMIDIDKVKLANETTVSVGNMKVNARGDVLGAGGKVVTGRNQIMDKVYAVDPAPYSPNTPANHAQSQAIKEASKSKELSDLANNLTVSISQAEENPQATAPAARGSLASSVAKPTSVTQEPLPNPNTSTGPTRI